MSGLARLLEAPDPFGARLKAKAVAPVRLKAAVEALAGDVGAFDVEHLAAFQARVAQAVRAGEAATLSRRDLKDACQAFLHAPRLLARDPAVADGLIAAVETLRRQAAVLALLDAYLDGFSPRDGEVAALALRLRRLLDAWPWRARDLWRERDRAFALFDAPLAPAKIATAVLASLRPPVEILANAGLDTEARRRGGLAETAFGYACAAVAGVPGARAVVPQVRLVDWAGLDGQRLAYPRAWAAYARALCGPWRGIEPRDDHKAFVLDAALKVAGDPRLNEAAWGPVRDEAPEAYDVLVRWLTRASIAQFFDIVSQSLSEPNEQRMWRQRRRFWTAWLDQGLIGAAWVAFGSDGAERAHSAARSSGDEQLALFGRIASGRGRRPQQAALILEIGDLTVCDWSHNGEWNIWSADDRPHPRLFQRTYDPQTLRSPREGLHGAHHSGWEQKVRRVIQDLTGLAA